MSGIFVVAAKRTPFGAFGGSFKNTSAVQLGVASTQAALQNIDPTIVDSIYFGNVIQTGDDAAYLSRHIGLKSGIPIATPALTLNRLCGSGFETVVQSFKSIQLGESHVSLAGGVESMSLAPLNASGTVRWGTSLGQGISLTDSLWNGLTDAHAGTPMGVTAENLGKKYDITRAECDEYAIRSQQLWKKANDNGVFQAEMAPVSVKNKKKEVLVDTDEHPRPDSTFEKINKLPSVFQKDGVVSAANASGICDGAGSVIIASEEAVKQHNLTPLARIVSYGVTGCEPTIMGIGPVTAIQQALSKAGLTLRDMDRVEINEAFAAQVLACAKELDLDMDKFNIHGGAISLGHPLGASGSRIMAHLVNTWSGNDKYYIGAACIGGGQGIAVLLEKC
ncbi:acetyl-CoA acyltransferase 2 [Fistulifera solaris]|jgi:acetyl-CoA acyltransferase 2|uniref:Acetyl-CoA acyltransferase 2 n=1 Tax=Fistulifera solaris TaxID=1519565 RepID=A0A1Z5JYA2_FISSO|nr:acetyl-CoA acyltransferase 2 [Fistulifera solaris]|eukprot:GAX18866.1 acetyl-CoA acyltransferase 2 [Fistulifera solaris]